MDSSHHDDETIRTLEIDLEVADIGELLESHGIKPTTDLVMALWDWKGARLKAAGVELP